MKIGLITHTNPDFSDALNHVFRSTVEGLQPEHEIIYRDPRYLHSSHNRRNEILRDMVLSCDMLLGTIDSMVLQARQDINRQIPYVCFLLGNMPRGATNMAANYHLFRTTDILVGNCTGDVTLARKFFENAQIRSIPFAFDESDYYPLGEASKRAIRAKLGIGPDDKVLLYSGRLTLEKNVHTIIRIFSVIQKLVPNLRLLVAGKEYYQPFMEFGVVPINLTGMLGKMGANLGIDNDSIKFLGHKDRASLREIYNIADVLVNLTLHHDENFGLAQIESMACGTPVVGTNWGGLKDTIVEGETGYKVSTLVTDSGVKVNWWEAVEKIVSLLRNDTERMTLSQNCQKIAYDRYSFSQYRQNLASIIADCQERASISGEPLKASEFARQFWASNAQAWQDLLGYRHGLSSYRMYKELISHYTGISVECADGRLKPNQVVCLAAPLISTEEMSFEINDPIYPLRISIPKEHREVACAVIGVMREEPAITIERLIKDYFGDRETLFDTLEWMIEAGLILKTEPKSGSISPRNIGGQMGVPLFSSQPIRYTSDFAVLR
jgi:glycosyltransferase involved in cell wall biosynthesis